ncbi:hypothetical protein PanWU01x14_289620 [Parasponia andersonii]|uniref:Transmembrane protein n=1 Tax=Parasponia andersonii TaxID=3476 RepID=A0A2P5AY21_PARAD|nr:hypothetical protein PanWU01x14_289620 [Parasponia andersonii]
MAEKLINYKAVEYGNEMLMGLGAASHKMGPVVGFDLMQNCDLPPPLKFFMGPEKTIVSSSTKYRPFSPIQKGIDNREEENDNNEFDGDVYRSDVVGDSYDKLELLKALRLSQTRAREAEKKAKVLAKEKDRLSRALVDEAKVLFAHRQWVRLLELQVSSLCSKSKADHHDEDHDRDHGCITWVMALAFCLGIAAFGCSYLF